MLVIETSVSSWESMSSHQKLSLGVFLAIGVASVVLWPFLVGKQITSPFKRKGGGAVFKTPEQVEQERDDKLRRSDTDNDGLNDYDELYVFRTSPFLNDSDSDGINDGKEVAENTDPNCPQGKTCRQSSLSVRSGQGAGSANANTPVNETSGSSSAPTSSTRSGEAVSRTGAAVPGDEERYMQAIKETFGDPDKLTPEGIKESLLTMSVTDLRSFLGKLGIPATALQKADDATLRKLISDTLNEIVIQNEAAANAGTAASGTTAPQTTLTSPQ